MFFIVSAMSFQQYQPKKNTPKSLNTGQANMGNCHWFDVFQDDSSPHWALGWDEQEEEATTTQFFNIHIT